MGSIDSKIELRIIDLERPPTAENIIVLLNGKSVGFITSISSTPYPPFPGTHMVSISMLAEIKAPKEIPLPLNLSTKR